MVAAALSRVTGRAVGFTLAPPMPTVSSAWPTAGWSTRRSVAAGSSRPPRSGRRARTTSPTRWPPRLSRSSYGVPAEAVHSGLAGYRPEPHRNAYVATVGGVDYVDDSKATNPHAAHASLTAYPRVVWVAGGQLKGVDIDDLVRERRRPAGRRRAAGRRPGADRAGARATRPGVPVVDVASTDDGAMGEVVRAAAELARPGDTVLLAPAAASYDMFRNYGHRGDAFAEAVRGLPAGSGHAD